MDLSVGAWCMITKCLPWVPALRSRLFRHCAHRGGRCVCVCVCVCVTRAFKDIKLNEKQPTESYWNTYVPDTSQDGSFHRYFSSVPPIISFLAPPLYMVFTVSKSTTRMQNYRRTQNQSGVSGNVFIMKRRRVRIHSELLSPPSLQFFYRSAS